jgi:hypothetical protein
MHTPKQKENTERLEQLLNAQDRMDYSFLEKEDTDALVERLIDSMQSSPLGRLLRAISTLPEVRAEKVEQARRDIHQPENCWDTKMDIALDRVLEELVVDE